MARIGIFSDTHGSLRNLDAFKERLGQVDAVFHLGDIAEDAPRLARELNSGFVSVRGNCDPWSDLPTERVIPWYGHRILLLHGHTCSGRLPLYYKAKSLNCDVVCSGHTHIASSELYDGIVLLNPGSLSLPRSSKGPSCAILTVTEAEISAELLFLS